MWWNNITGLQSTGLPDMCSFLFIFALLTFFRVDAMFTHFTNELRISINNAEFRRLRNTAPRIVSVSGELFLLGIAIRWLKRAISLFFFSFLLDSRADYVM